MAKSEMIPFKRIVFEQGGSLSITIPIELVEFLDLKPGIEINISGDISKHGKFLGLWNPVQQKRSK